MPLWIEVPKSSKGFYLEMLATLLSMETTLTLVFFAALVIGRLYAGRRAAEFIAGLPADERTHIERVLARGTY